VELIHASLHPTTSEMVVLKEVNSSLDFPSSASETPSGCFLDSLASRILLTSRGIVDEALQAVLSSGRESALSKG
jgi:hypothetical protein